MTNSHKVAPDHARFLNRALGLDEIVIRDQTDVMKRLRAAAQEQGIVPQALVRKLIRDFVGVTPPDQIYAMELGNLTFLDNPSSCVTAYVELSELDKDLLEGLDTASENDVYYAVCEHLTRNQQLNTDVAKIRETYISN